MLKFLGTLDFWVFYVAMVVSLWGVFYYVGGKWAWYERGQSGSRQDRTVAFGRVACSIGCAILWPILGTFFVTQYLCKKAETGPKQKDRVRCNSCASLINLTDSFCPICGADQTERKKASK